MKLLICQDTHIKGINPVNRKGSYLQEVMDKMKEITSLAKEKKVDCIIHGGDVFDIPIVSNLIVDELVDLIEEGKISWKIVPGNHDMIGHYWENSKGSSLAHIFRRSRFIKELDIINDIDNKLELAFTIQGFKYYHNIEQDLKDKGLYSNYPETKYKIAVIHSMITEKPLMEGIPHICYKDLKTDFDIIFVAHNHLKWGIIEHNGVRFVNLGCIGRTGIDEVKIKPTVAILDTNTKEIELIELKSAKPAEEVFDIERVNKNKQYKDDVERFINSLSEEKLEDLDLMQIIEKLAKESKLEDYIKEEIIRRI